MTTPSMPSDFLKRKREEIYFNIFGINPQKIPYLQESYLEPEDIRRLSRLKERVEAELVTEYDLGPRDIQRCRFYRWLVEQGRLSDY